MTKPAVPGIRVSPRDRLASSVYRKFSKDFIRRGQGAIDRVYEEDPASYLKITTSLLPKQVDVGLAAGFGDFLRELAQLSAPAASAPLPCIEGELAAAPSSGALEHSSDSATPPAPGAEEIGVRLRYGVRMEDMATGAQASVEDMLAQFLED